MFTNMKKLQIFVQRNQKTLSVCLYSVLLSFSLYAIYDPAAVIHFLFPRTFVTDEDYNSNANGVDLPLFFRFTTTPRVIPSLRMMNLPFVPKETHKCEEFFYKAGRNFSYAEFYWEHMDAYKSALTITGVMGESNVNEQSWAFHEIGKLDFVTNVCETGFFAGHNTFQWLTAKTDLTVHSFESKNYNWTEDLATFMSAEFPDHFYFYQGDTIKKIAKFAQDNNKTRCDVVYVDSSNGKETILKEVEQFRKIASPIQNLFIMDLHGKVEDSLGHTIWNLLKEKSYIIEHFKCEFASDGDALSVRSHNVSGFYVGSFIF